MDVVSLVATSPATKLLSRRGDLAAQVAICRVKVSPAMKLQMRSLEDVVAQVATRRMTVSLAMKL
jgi:hypothetical protein